MSRFWILYVLAGCSAHGGADSPDGSGPDYTAGVDDICFAETRSGAIAQFPFMDKAQALNGWLEQRLTDPAAHKLYFETILQASVLEQGNHLRTQATAVGIDGCPLAGYLDFIGRMSSQAATLESCAAACLERNRDTGDEAQIRQTCLEGCGG